MTLGHWTTALDSTTHTMLSSCWRKRKEMLSDVRQSSHSRWRATLVFAVAFLIFSVPMIRSTASDGPTIADSSVQNDAASEPDIPIRGICVDENELPLANVDVGIYSVPKASTAGPRLCSIRTKDDGRFDLGTVPGFKWGASWWPHYELIATCEGRGTVQLTIHQQSDVGNDYKLTMHPAVSISGRVSDKGGNAIHGARVFIPTTGFREGILGATTDINGHFTIDDLSQFHLDGQIFDGGQILYSLRVTHPAFAQQFNVLSPDSKFLEFCMEPGALVKGRVLDDVTGMPAAGVTVFTQSCKESYWGQSVTDTDGRYEIRSLPAEDYNIWAKMPDRTVVAIDSLAISTGESKEAPDLHLIEGGFIIGRVLDAATGKPVNFKKSDYADIALYGPSRPRSGAAVEIAPIAADGSYRLRAAPGKNYPYFRSTHWDAGAENVMVRDGELVVKDFLVRPK